MAKVTDRQIEAALKNAPSWITAKHLRETLAVFQPLHEQSLTAKDALKLFLKVGEFFEGAQTVDRLLLDHITKGR